MTTHVSIGRGFLNPMPGGFRVHCMSWTEGVSASVGVVIPGSGTSVDRSLRVGDPVPLMPGWRLVQVGKALQEGPPGRTLEGMLGCVLGYQDDWVDIDRAKEPRPSAGPHQTFPVHKWAEDHFGPWEFLIGRWEPDVVSLHYTLGSKEDPTFVSVEGGEGTPLPLVPGWTIARILPPPSPSPSRDGDMVALLEGPEPLPELTPRRINFREGLPDFPPPPPPSPSAGRVWAAPPPKPPKAR